MRHPFRYYFLRTIFHSSAELQIQATIGCIFYLWRFLIIIILDIEVTRTKYVTSVIFGQVLPYVPPSILSHRAKFYSHASAGPIYPYGLPINSGGRPRYVCAGDPPIKLCLCFSNRVQTLDSYVVTRCTRACISTQFTLDPQ